MNRDHLKIVAESLTGQRPADEETRGALKVLADRLRQVRSLGGSFAGIEFSGHVRQLCQECRAVPIG